MRWTPGDRSNVEDVRGRTELARQVGDGHPADRQHTVGSTVDSPRPQLRQERVHVVRRVQPLWTPGPDVRVQGPRLVCAHRPATSVPAR